MAGKEHELTIQQTAGFFRFGIAIVKVYVFPKLSKRDAVMKETEISVSKTVPIMV